MKYQISILAVIAIVLISASAGALISRSVSTTGEPDWFDIEVDAANGTNSYTLIEVDEGDNNEERVVTEHFHVFEFSAINPAGAVTWDFGDGNSGMGYEVNHSYEEPDLHGNGHSIDSQKCRQCTVDCSRFEAFVESDNMECECAPTAKDTVIDITP